MDNQQQLCPRCGDVFLKQNQQRNALSRGDNKTNICSGCGTQEALEDSGLISKWTGHIYWHKQPEFYPSGRCKTHGDVNCLFCKKPDCTYCIDPDEDMCRLDKDLDGYGCTREAGHGGKCVACGIGPDEHDITNVYRDVEEPERAGDYDACPCKDHAS